MGGGDGVAHLADEVGGGLDRLHIDAYFVQVDRVGDVAETGCAEMTHDGAELPGGGGDPACHEQLTGLGLPCDSGGEIDRRSVVVTVDGDGRTVVCSGAREEQRLVSRSLRMSSWSATTALVGWGIGA